MREGFMSKKNCCLSWLTALLISLVQAGPVLAQSLVVAERRPLNSARANPVNGFIVKHAIADAAGMPPAAAAALNRPLSEPQQTRLAALERQLGLKFRVGQPNRLGHRTFVLDRYLSLAEAEKLARRIKQSDPEIVYATPNIQLKLDSIPNDFSWLWQWSLWEVVGGIDLPAARDIYPAHRLSTDPHLPIVAIIDTGYRSHEDLAPPLQGTDYVDGQAPPLDTGDSWAVGECASAPSSSQPYNSWHGMKIHGIIAAVTNNAIGMAGIDQQLKVYHGRFFGKCGGTMDKFVNSIGDAVSYRSPAGQRVRVINLSVSGVAVGGLCSPPLQEAISAAVSAGVVVVASAGNGGGNANLNQPANCAGVITVAATDRAGAKTAYSDSGSVVALAAPGGVTSPSAENGIIATSHAVDQGQSVADNLSRAYAWVQGTSYSAPVVSALAGMMLNVNPLLTPAEIRAHLQASTRSLSVACPGCGAGIVDARAAIARVNTNVPQLIEFNPLSDRGLAEPGGGLIASATSGLVVSFSASPADVCVWSGSTLATVGLGVCTVVASQPGNSIYQPAPSVSRSFAVKPAQSISFGSLPSRGLTSGSFSVTASASSGLAVSFVSSTASVCSVTGNVVSLLSVGVCSITARQAGDMYWAPAPAVSRAFNVLNPGAGSGSEDIPTLPQWAALCLGLFVVWRLMRQARAQA
jgi:serine protease